MLAHKMLVKIITSIVSSLLMFISLMIMARHVFSEYGIMMFGWSIVGLVNTLTDLGFDAASVKFISQKKDLAACVSTHLFLKSILIGIMVLITLVFLGVSILTDSISMENAMVVLVFMIYFSMAGIAWVFIRTFDGRLEAAKSSLVQASDVSMRSIVLIIVALAGSSAVILSTGYLVGAAFSIVIALILIRKIKIKLVRPVYLKEYVRFARPVAVGLMLVAAISFTDRVIVGTFWGTDDLGYYSIAMGVAYAATSIGFAINYVLLPKFSEMVSVSGNESLRVLVWNSEKYLSILFLPVIIFTMVFGNNIVTALFGQDNEPAGIVLSILSVYIYLYIILGILTQILLSTNNNRLYRNATIVFAVSTFIMLLILVPENIGPLQLAGYGPGGAAVAVTAGYLIFTILTSYYVKVSTKLSLHKGLLRQFAAAAVVFVLIYYIEMTWSFGLPVLMLLLLLCYILFIGLSMVFREITKDDLASVMRTVNHRSAKKGTKKEKN